MPSAPVVAAVSFVGLWASMLVLCAPTLASSACRRLFAAGPSEYLLVNYAAGVGGFTFVHVLLVFAGALVNQVVRVTIGWWFVGVTLFVAAAGWWAASVRAPKRGVWDPTTSGVDGRAVLGVTAVWYVVWSFALAALFAFAWFLRYYPGG
ncbi:MAG: hypothetical protein ABEJ78_02665 [Haloferacaceae archaeon]